MSTSRQTLGELADRVLAAGDAAARATAIRRLIRVAPAAEQVAAIAERFLAAGAAGQGAFLEWVARVRGPLPTAVLARIPPLLSDRTLPVSVRVAAAARALRAAPETTREAKRIALPLTAGLSPLRRLERLRRLQHQVERSRGLDRLIERRERRVKVGCPRCDARLVRAEMVKHLWHEHGLFLDGGQVRSPRRTVDDLRTAHAQTRDTTVLDRAALVGGAAGLREWVAATDPGADDVAILLADAAEHDAGLCPACFSEAPAAFAPLPPPLVLAHGRLSGEGFEVAISGGEWIRTLRLTDPAGTPGESPDTAGAIGPRAAASFAALLILVAGLVAIAAVPVATFPPVILMFRAALVAAVVYGLVMYFRKPLPKASGRAVDAAWEHLVPRLAARPAAARFLTRLCRTSIGRGDPALRAKDLARLVDRAGGVDGDDELRLLAAASLLQIEDGAGMGRDRVSGVADLIAAALRGDRPAAFAEYVAACFLNQPTPPDAGEVARLRILALTAAFAAGLRPRTLLDLWAGTPNLRRAMALEPFHRVGLLHGMWGLRTGRAWERIARADTVFDLARIAPRISGRVLADFPDLLLYHSPPDLDADLAPILVCARGVAVGGHLVSDPAAEVEVRKAGRFGGYELTFGPHRIRLTERPDDTILDAIRGWLRYRSAVVLPTLDGYLDPGAGTGADRLVGPLLRTCGTCGLAVVAAAGKLGRVVRSAAVTSGSLPTPAP